MTEPVRPRPAPLGLLIDVLVVIAAVGLTIYVLVDDSGIPAWFVRLSWAGAIVAGLALALHALHRLIGRP